MSEQLALALHRAPYLRPGQAISWINGRQVTATYDPPPIPGWEQHAWKASFDDRDGKPVGYGATAAEAFEDLRQWED